MIIQNSIFNIPVINNVILYETTDSTNTRAKELGNSGCVDGTLIIAEMQTAGRGRLNRSFSSPSGDGIYMSLLLKPSVDVTLVSQITLIAAMSVVDAFSDIAGISSQIKWPNDIIVNGKKTVGILTEMSCDTIRVPKTYGLADLDYSEHSAKSNVETSLKYVIVGIGINVNNESFPEEISKTAGSLYQACGRKLNREKLILKIWECFSTHYHAFLKSGDLLFMMDQYNAVLASYDKDIYLIPHEKSEMCQNPYLINTDELTPYHCMGIDSHGDLICRHPDGRLMLVNSGEVSVRGINGSYI